jgi:hypothetical protein
MTGLPPELVRCLAFITGRLAKATRDAQMRPTHIHQQRVRSLEILAAACVGEAARLTARPGAGPRLEPAPPPAGERGVWTPPAG